MNNPEPIFLAQTDGMLITQDHVLTLYNAVKAHNWLLESSDHFKPCDIVLTEYKQVYQMTDEVLQQNPIYKEFPEYVIPIGSLEFTQAVVEVLKDMKPGTFKFRQMVLPKCLWDFACRKIDVIENPYQNMDKVEEFIQNCRWSHVRLKFPYIKDSRNGEYAPVVACTAIHPDDEYALIQEELPEPSIISEYRIFISENKMVHSAWYRGDYTVIPDYHAVEVMIDELANSGAIDEHTAYTLDVMVLSDNRTAPIEMHQFYCCGLYGFDHFKLFGMMTRTWIRNFKTWTTDV